MEPTEHREGMEIPFYPFRLRDGRITGIVIYGPPNHRMGRLMNHLRELVGLEPRGVVHYAWFDAHEGPHS